MYGYGYTPPPAPPIGRWMVANSFEEIQNAPIAMDGSQTIYMMSQEPVFYVMSMANGQRMIQGYKFEPLTNENRPKPAATIEERLKSVEEVMAKLTSILEGGKADESNISNPASVQAKAE